LANHTVARTAHFAMHRSEPEATPPALPEAQPVGLGAMVPKRWAKRAVTRNLIKRQIYSLGDGIEDQLFNVNHVVRLRATFDRKQFKSACSEQLKAAVRLELEQLFRKAVRPKVMA
jgi:ribonuclease P protein component